MIILGGGGELTGIFNNEQVEIIIEENSGTGKVWGIYVFNQNEYSKDEAIRKFNNLVRQFDAKQNYTRREHPLDIYYIPNHVDNIDFDRNVDKEKYAAFYYQGNSKMNLVEFWISKKPNSGKYGIAIHYQNLYNEQKDGEDL